MAQMLIDAEPDGSIAYRVLTVFAVLHGALGALLVAAWTDGTPPR